MLRIYVYCCRSIGSHNNRSNLEENRAPTLLSCSIRYRYTSTVNRSKNVERNKKAHLSDVRLPGTNWCTTAVCTRYSSLQQLITAKLDLIDYCCKYYTSILPCKTSKTSRVRRTRYNTTIDGPLSIAVLPVPMYR